ncbi:unnamed protein product [Adineta ricciae]|uniref:Uncharacterized protein n=1 Tax=Adineta ricciae TaxID=249248 RepID=A0A814QMA4_ADIRI|nr:unnamed protein product [Adineta ricciae]CAF1409391.1 unnamed protein product [Adineta ricciae]
MVSQTWLTLVLCFTVECNFDFYVSSRSQYDCLYYYTTRTGFITKTKYCFRSTTDVDLMPIEDFINTRDQNYTFHQLFQINVTAHDIFHWSASIDVAEQYQDYLDHHNTSLQANQLFYNCTPPWFGSRCQYSLESDEIEPTALATGHTCYVLLDCDRGGAALCLDWREVCDGRIDCLNNGVDEASCFDLEMNECEPNEYRCHNGQCIPHYHQTLEQITAECLDQSDAWTDSLCPNSHSPASIFQCEEVVCPPGQKKFSCGDGQCVDDFDECTNGRHLMLFESLTVQGSLPDDCWLAMVCLTRLMHHIDPTFCNGTSIHPSHLHACDHLIQFPISPVLFGHVHFLYQPKQVFEVTNDSMLLPDYICYDEQLCTYLSPTFRHRSHTCRHAHHMGLSQNTKYHSWKRMIRVIKPYFVGCTTRHTDERHPSLYQCRNSSKYISKHRIADNITDCYLNDDEEDHELSCFIDHPHRFKCANESRCRSPILQRLGCPLVENETKTIDSILFNQICDGFVDVSAEVVDGHGHTDETDCEYWPCSNVYSRCDGFWNCRNGEDEEACQASNCSRGLFECMSLFDYTRICLAGDKVRDGTVDCVGGLDEPQLCQGTNAESERLYRFSCLDGRTCIEPYVLCDSDGELINEEELCTEWIGYNLTKIRNVLCHFGRLNHAQFTLEESPIYPLAEDTMFNTIGVAKTKLLKTHNSLSRCIRGLLIRLWLGDKNYTTICMCPPNYYGNLCQYQNQRVSLTVTLSSVSTYGIYTIFIKLVDDDDDRQQVHSYEQIIYVSKATCGQPFDKYLLYSTTPKDPSKNYSIRIDAYDSMSLEYIASWYFRVLFNFLPVNRMAALLTLDSNRTFDTGFCSLGCEHGICVKYINVETTFCQCDRGWSGARCHIPVKCTDCSPASLCVGQVHNQSICICPLGKFGIRCLLKHSCPANYCENNGQCVVTDEQVNDGSYECLCADAFRGKRCEHRKARLHIVFNNRDISSYLIAYIYSFVNSEPPLPQQTLLKKLTKMQNSIILYSQHVVQIVFILSNHNYYLVVSQQSGMFNISATVDSTRRCPLVHQLLSSEQTKLPRIQRVKHYHTLCQHHPDLKCFFDESYMCLCTTDHHANCFPFDHKPKFECQENVHCLNGGQCLQDHPQCPATTICECNDCYFGDRCQFYARGIGLTLDDLFRYEIRSDMHMSSQSQIVKFSIFLTLVLFLTGLVNSMLSLATFLRCDTRAVGCGIYILTLSITSLLTVAILMLKFWFVLLTQMNVATNYTVLRYGCLLIEPLLRIFSWMNNWLNATISIERAVTVWKGIYFSKSASIYAARRIVIFLPLVVMSSNMYESVSRDLFHDVEEDRFWCFTLYSSSLYIYTTIVLFIHLMVPFFINIVTALYVIYTIARQRATTRTHKTRYQHFKEQLCQQKHLIISPIMLIVLTFPLVIISLLFRCVKASQSSLLYIFSYYMSFIPSTLIFVIYVLPSPLYKKEFINSMKLWRQLFGY